MLKLDLVEALELMDKVCGFKEELKRLMRDIDIYKDIINTVKAESNVEWLVFEYEQKIASAEQRIKEVKASLFVIKTVYKMQ